MSKILFIGDSFTWGQGLYFYKWIEENKKLPQGFGPMFPSHSDILTDDDLIYKDNLSYTKLVSEYYKGEPIKILTNGGSNTEHIFEMLSMIDRYRDEIEKVVFQFTALSRYQFRDLNLKFDETYDGDFEKLYNNRVGEFFNYIDSILKYHSSIHKFEYCYLDWLGDVWNHSPNQFVTYNVDGIDYTHFNEFLEQYKLNLIIDNQPVIDLHLNKEGQYILYKSIIKHFDGKR